ncbi:MAG: pseudouridine synthase [Candidatus Hydrogenedentes bacterium]|nr:pseudouridine synthase [Candidatus Hydrogenedentota bacterium]
MRLQQFMAASGVASRRASEAIITAGRVTVNGIVATLGQSVNPETDQVCVDGKPLATDTKVYVLLNKPRGVVTTAKDTHNRRTVLDCVSTLRSRVFPVGRLDFDVEGALLLTNDGELAYRLTHPKYQIEKVYLAWVQGRMTTDTAIRLEKGVELEDGMTAPAKVQILSLGENSTLVQLVLIEGRNREVKRMCMHVGHPVNELQRIAIGGVKVKGLQPGAWRLLAPSEVGRLYQLTGITE